jgi:hypothetical protein
MPNPNLTSFNEGCSALEVVLDVNPKWLHYTGNGEHLVHSFPEMIITRGPPWRLDEVHGGKLDL